jgi:hypothetical protein
MVHLIQKYLKFFARDHVNDVNNNVQGVFEVEAYRAPHTAYKSVRTKTTETSCTHTSALFKGFNE